MTAENDLHITPLTNLHYVTPTNKSDEHSGRGGKRYKRKNADRREEESKEAADDNGTDTLHVIDYCA